MTPLKMPSFFVYRKEFVMRNISIEKDSIWKHFKGNVIKVISVATDTEDLSLRVVYVHDDKIWVRPITSFLSDEDVSSRSDNVTGQKYRFELVKESENND